MENNINEINIKCECGAAQLLVQNEINFKDNSNTDFIQTFYLAMFSFGDHEGKYMWWKRFKIALNFIKTGKMFSDQIVLSPEEAKKLSSFINENINLERKLKEKKLCEELNTPSFQQFNNIKDLRNYLLRHPNRDMVTTSCLHFLGEEVQ